jgi:hypothetical protein
LDYLDYIIDPSSIPEKTRQGEPWSHGRWYRTGRIHYATQLPVVHIAYSWDVEDIRVDESYVEFGEAVLDTARLPEFPRHQSLPGVCYTTPPMTLCPTKYSSNAITPLFPGFLILVGHSEWSRVEIPWTEQKLCKRCQAAYWALRSDPESPRSQQLLRGLGMRHLKDLRL